MAVCVRCKYSITWAEQRRQFARLMHRGFTIDEAKAAMPRCQVCTTRYMKDAKEQAKGLPKGCEGMLRL
jgi:hypothetical protein